jgi:hypothetical protein
VELWEEASNAEFNNDGTLESELVWHDGELYELNTKKL